MDDGNSENYGTLLPQKTVPSEQVSEHIAENVAPDKHCQHNADCGRKEKCGPCKGPPDKFPVDCQCKQKRNYIPRNRCNQGISDRVLHGLQNIFIGKYVDKVFKPNII